MFNVLKNSNVKLNCKRHEKNDIYCCCNICSFKKFATCNKEELSDLLKDLI